MLQLFEKTGLQRTWGDCYGFLMLAAGRIDLMLDPKLQVWDLAAIIPIIEEAGGSVTRLDGVRDLNGGQAVASNGILHTELLSLLRETP